MTNESPPETRPDALPVTRLSVRPEWIDHNGHMNVAFFVLAFDEATDAIYEDWGLGLDYPKVSRCSVFTLGMNVDYRAELFSGDAIEISTQLVDMDSKRLHYYHRMYKGGTGEYCAGNECLVMNVDLTTRRSTEFAAPLRSKLEAVHRRHAEHGKPPGFGRTLEIRRR